MTAANWYAQRNRSATAVRHAQQAHAWLLAARQLNDFSAALGLSGQVHTTATRGRPR